MTGLPPEFNAPQLGYDPEVYRITATACRVLRPHQGEHRSIAQ